LDDAFRTFLAERGAKALGLADVTALVTGVAGIRLAADAVAELWAHPVANVRERAAVRSELSAAARSVAGWYENLGDALALGSAVPDAQPADVAAADRLLEAVRRDLAGPDGSATATGVRIVWTGDHVDVVRRLEAELTGPATSAARVVRSRRRRAVEFLPALQRRVAVSR
jgi:phosphoserine phosphatase